MLNQDPVHELFRCHQQARDAMKQLAQLGEKSEFAAQDLEDRDAIVWFLRGPLAWHDLDEEASLNRRIRMRAKDVPEVLGAIERVSEQHEALENAAETLIPLLESATSGENLVAPIKRLTLALIEHLKDEERNIFPAARAYLTQGDLNEIAAEISARAQRRADKTPAAVELKFSAA